jgi:cell division protease FtsH
VVAPSSNKGMRTRSEMIAQLVFAMGGRAAEELVFREPTTGAVSDIEQATKIARAMVTEYGMSSKLGAVKYGTEHGDPFLGRTMGNQADYSHEVARDIDDEVRKLIEAAHTEAWEILTEYRDILDTLAGELLEKETLHRPELEGIFSGVEKRPRLTMFDDFGGRIPSDKPPIKTPGELAIERGEPWPPPVPEPAFKAAIAKASRAAAAAQLEADRNANGGNGSHGPGDRQGGPHATQPDYGAPAGWRAPGWPPADQQPNQWHPPAHPQQPYWPQPARGYPGPQNYPGQQGYPGGQQGYPGQAQPSYPPYPPYPPPGQPAPDGGSPDRQQDDDVSRSNPPARG